MIDAYITGIDHAKTGVSALESALSEATGRIQISVIRERTNVHDANAILARVSLKECSASFGYLASPYARVLSPLLDVGLIQVWFEARRTDVIAAIVSPKAPLRVVGFVRLTSQNALCCFHGVTSLSTSA